MSKPKELITITNPREIGTWGETPLFMGKLTGHPRKMEAEWPYTLTDGKFIKVKDVFGHNERLLEVEFK